MLTGRDAAHKRIHDMLARGEKLPVDFTAGHLLRRPVDPVRDEVVGPPARPRDADGQFTEMMLAETGLFAMIGKAERGPVAIEAIRKHRSAYLMGRRRRRLPGLEGDPQGPHPRLRGPRHGSDLRIRGQGHAGDGRGRFQRQLGARDRPGDLEGEDRRRPGGYR
jgi:hypothetical protein